jgi:hypothetical protein
MKMSEFGDFGVPETPNDMFYREKQMDALLVDNYDTAEFYAIPRGADEIYRTYNNAIPRCDGSRRLDTILHRFMAEITHELD